MQKVKRPRFLSLERRQLAGQPHKKREPQLADFKNALQEKNFRHLLSAPGTSSCPVAGPVGYLFPGLTVYLVDILGKAESLAAFHAAQAAGPSPDQ